VADLAFALGLRGVASDEPGRAGVLVTCNSSTGLLVVKRAGITAAGAQAAPPLPESTSGGGVAHQRQHSLRVFVDRAIVETHLDARRTITTAYLPINSTASTDYALLNPSWSQRITIASVEVWGMRSMFEAAAAGGAR
jgi:hypothetical protein